MQFSRWKLPTVTFQFLENLDTVEAHYEDKHRNLFDGRKKRQSETDLSSCLFQGAGVPLALETKERNVGELYYLPDLVPCCIPSSSDVNCANPWTFPFSSNHDICAIEYTRYRFIFADQKALLGNRHSGASRLRNRLMTSWIILSIWSTTIAIGFAVHHPFETYRPLPMLSKSGNKYLEHQIEQEELKTLNSKWTVATY